MLWLRSGREHLGLELAVEVRQRMVLVEARRELRSGGEHFAVEVRQGTLGVDLT